MSIQFGRWNLDGRPIDSQYLEKVSSMISVYGPDGSNCYAHENVAMSYHALHTTEESQREKQPYTLCSGHVITWDGRIDNRPQLISDLGGSLLSDSTDLEIFGKAYERWGTDCLARVVGDWAVAMFNSRERELLLARDFAGIRQLYYSVSDTQITWSSLLDPLVLLAEKSFTLCENYLAGWLSSYPAAELTPYSGLRSVPPSSFVRFKGGVLAIQKYWDFDPAKRVRYASDEDYEEQFRTVFKLAVQRRLRSNGCVLMELSGGMDSSAIVCMSDTIARTTNSPRCDTVSFYDNAEPNWNERPFFTRVEEVRGQTGHHVAIDPEKLFQIHTESTRFQATPGCTVGCHTEAVLKLGSIMRSEKIHVVLSGIGGDEVSGGVPAATPELQDLLVSVRLPELAHRLRMWALSQRRPWFHLLMNAVRGFLPRALFGGRTFVKPMQWLDQNFVRHHRATLAGDQERTRLLGPLPSFQANIIALGALRRQLACDALTSDPPFERRYPYLDRTLLEFIFAIPREQVVRPGQRRSLMRRALVGIVPREILERKRKAFVTRGSRVAISSEWPQLIALRHGMHSSLFGIVDPDHFFACLEQARSDAEVPLVRLMRALFLELWLRSLGEHGVRIEMPSGLIDQLEPPEQAISG